MKGIVKLTFFMAMMIIIITVCMEVIILYMNRAQLVGITGQVMQMTTEMAAFQLEDAEEDMIFLDHDKSAIHTAGLVDSFSKDLEAYILAGGQDIHFVMLNDRDFLGETYDYVLTYTHSGAVGEEDKISRLNVYIRVTDTGGDGKRVDTVIDADTFFH